MDSTGETVTFASELSSSFFSALQEACHSFMDLFADHSDRPEILNLLLSWVQKQVSAYVEILVPHVRHFLTLISCYNKACSSFFLLFNHFHFYINIKHLFRLCIYALFHYMYNNYCSIVIKTIYE